jgi:hypothetical protein
MVAAAIIGGAVVGGIATGVGGSEAAGATNNATNANVAEQNAALQQQATLSQPYRDLGSAAIPEYEALLGIGPQGSAGIADALKSMPGYQFTQQQGQTGILNAASAAGGVGGNTLAALDQFNTGLADSTYQQQVGNISSAVASGQAAAAGQAQNVGTAAANIGGALQTQGNTIAGIDANEAAGINKAIGGAGDQYLQYQTLQALQAQGG